MSLKNIGTAQVVNILLAVCVLLLILKFSSKPGQKMDSENHTLEIIHKRKSVRNYTDKKVSKEQLESLVKAGMAAPTAVNKQP